MTDYAEMAKLAKRIEFLESREVTSGAESWLRLEKRLAALEGESEVHGERLDLQVAHRDGIKKRLAALEERQEAMETLHYKGVYPEAHNYPEPVHNESAPMTCGECCNAYWQEGEYNGLCGKATTVGCWIRRTSLRCTVDFEAKKGAA